MLIINQTLTSSENYAALQAAEKFGDEQLFQCNEQNRTGLGSGAFPSRTTSSTRCRSTVEAWNSHGKLAKKTLSGPVWKGPYTMILSTPSAVKIPEFDSWIHHS